jgi:hypothetical protein
MLHPCAKVVHCLLSRKRMTVSLYVLKFRGAGQGVKALIAELIGGEIARALGFKVPEIVFAQLDSAFGRTEPDEEIQDLLKASVGTNLALHYLSAPSHLIQRLQSSMKNWLQRSYGWIACLPMLTALPAIPIC